MQCVPMGRRADQGLSLQNRSSLRGRKSKTAQSLDLYDEHSIFFQVLLYLTPRLDLATLLLVQKPVESIQGF